MVTVPALSVSTAAAAPVRVLHVTPSLSRAGAGVSEVAWNLAYHGRCAGLEPIVAGLRDENTDADAAAYAGVPYVAHRRIGPAVLGYSRSLSKYLLHAAAASDVLHMHGIWMWTGFAARRAAARSRTPRVLSPHGMLEPWALRQAVIKKAFARRLYESKNLRTAEAIHATAAPEARTLRRLGLANPIIIIGNGVDLSNYATTRLDGEVEARWPELRGYRRILFLSRLHRVKGTMHLARAWGALHGRFPDWRLVMAGPDEDGHRAEVEAALAASDALARTIFTGPVYGEAKRALYASCDVFVQPSFTENFGITIAESLASGRPVITTDGTPWKQLPEYRCGWRIPVGTEPLEACLEGAMRLDTAELEAMGRRGRRLIEEQFTWSRIAAQMADGYRWVLGSGSRPAFVVDTGERVPD